MAGVICSTLTKLTLLGLTGTAMTKDNNASTRTHFGATILAPEKK
jgi:type I site-specific restriction-modification system R (restriction) subunit